jgi:hypothetical protein
MKRLFSVPSRSMTNAGASRQLREKRQSPVFALTSGRMGPRDTDKEAQP